MTDWFSKGDRALLVEPMWIDDADARHFCDMGLRPALVQILIPAGTVVEVLSDQLTDGALVLVAGETHEGHPFEVFVWPETIEHLDH